MQPALDYLERNRDRFLDTLFDLLRIPSISAQSEYAAESRRAAEFVRARLEAAGMDDAGLFEADGLPTVHARHDAGADRPTLLVYGHYDVQPPEPLDLWETPPFEPTVVDGEIRARGCADDKGPTLAMIFAAECWLKGTGALPLNLKFAIEGEEECGGSVISDFIAARGDDYAADALAIADVSGVAHGVPALCYGLRGLVVVEIELKGPSRDLHSGFYGGAVANPATALARLVASLHEDGGRVAVNGFYDGVAGLDKAERTRLAALPFDEQTFLQECGSPALFGEAGYTTWERKAARPTCEINGIFGGYMGEGTKTIIPSTAGCKITCRLVPGQNPAAVYEALEAHLRSHCPPGVILTLHKGHLAAAVYTDPETEWAKRARSAMEQAFGKPAALMREGGSIPVVNTFREKMGLQPLLLGTYAPGEKAHSPNERYFVEDFFAGIRTGIHLLDVNV